MRKQGSLLAAVGVLSAMVLCLPACRLDDPDNQTGSTTTSSVPATSLDYLDDPLPDPVTAGQELAFGLNTFGVELYRVLRAAVQGDLVISPLSISQCLAMVYAGARSATEQQMAAVLHYTLAQEELHPAFGALNKQLLLSNNADDTAELTLALKIANSGWLQDGSNFLPSWIDILTGDYRADVTRVDFAADPEQARLLINQWADNATEGKIPELVPPEVVNSLLRFVVVNALYFRGSWQIPFSAEDTADQPFYLLDGSTVDVPMMSGQGVFAYLEGSGFRAVALPFAAPARLSLMILLPNTGLFEEAEGILTAGGIYAVAQNLEFREVALAIPRYYSRTKRDLKNDLKALGMTDLFEAGTADLSGLHGGSSPEELYVGFVIHESVIEVNEKGTEAAAATAAGGFATGMPDEPAVFTADRPFLYAVYDRDSDAVLFIGRVLQPQEREQ